MSYTIEEIHDQLKTVGQVEKGCRNKEVFKWFVDNFLRYVVGNSKYIKCTDKLVKDWITASSVAFAILCYANYYHKVVDTVVASKVKAKENANKDKDTDKDKDKEKEKEAEPEIRTTQWTHGGKGAKRNQGWKVEGIEKFNKLYQEVMNDRVQNFKVDEKYMVEKKEEKLNKKKRRKRKAIEECERGWIRAIHDDFSDIDEDENDREETASDVAGS